MSVNVAAVAQPDQVEEVRRGFARAWGRMGAAWGVPPSTAEVQGYLLVHGGPLTDAEIRDALGLSHRAVRLALEDCEAWGIIKRAPDVRRSGRRGPPGRAWVAVDDNWEWIRHVVAGRKEREGDPVLAILEDYGVQANALGRTGEAADLSGRIATLLEFVRQFDHVISAFMRADPNDMAKLFRVLNKENDVAVDLLVAKLGALPEDELQTAIHALARLPLGTIRQLLSIAAKPGLLRLLGGR
jgi:DNA-binding transcriptional regulator GbsR (MarR family)